MRKDDSAARFGAGLRSSNRKPVRTTTDIIMEKLFFRECRLAEELERNASPKSKALQCQFCRSELASGSERAESHGHEMYFSVGLCPRCGWWDLVYCERGSSSESEEEAYYQALIDELPSDKFDRLSSAALRNELAIYSGRLYDMTPRKVEELIAGIFNNVLDCRVGLTATTRDGGRDLIGFDSNNCHFIVEIKRYAPERKVGVELVRQLLGVMYLDQVHRGLLVTTSDFTAPARAAAQQVIRRGEFSLELKDMANIRDWLRLGFTQYFDLSVLDSAIHRIASWNSGQFPRSFSLADGKKLDLEHGGLTRQ